MKAEDGAAEKVTEDGAAETAPVANGEDSSKLEENSAASGSSEPAKQKKRFSFKKPFKLSGFSFKKGAKKEAEEAAAAPAEEGKDKAESEEAKPEASGEKEEAAEGAKADQPSADEEKKSSEEQKPETPAEEKPAEAATEEPAPAPAPTESSDAQPAAAEE